MRAHIPGAVVTYNPDPVIMDYYRTAQIEKFDDSCARDEWGWRPEYTTIEALVPDFINEVRVNPHRYGL